MIDIWLDDIRDVPLCVPWSAQTIRVRTAPDCVRALIALHGQVGYISLDHDLGESEDSPRYGEVGSGYEVAKWLEDKAHAGEWCYVPNYVLCHSMNQVGKRKILQAIYNINKWRSRA